MKNHSNFIGVSSLIALLLTACKQSTVPPATEAKTALTQDIASQPNKISTSNHSDEQEVIAISPDTLQTLGKEAVKIFYENCVLTAADSEKIIENAQKNQLFELSAKQKNQFQFSPLIQHVWGIHSAQGGQYFVESGEHMCSVKAHYADEATVRTEIRKMVDQSAIVHGLTYHLISDRSNVNQLPIKELVYVMQQANAPSQYLITVYTSMSHKTPVQATLNFRLLSAK